jgi:hypothetical protein
MNEVLESFEMMEATLVLHGWVCWAFLDKHALLRYGIGRMLPSAQVLSYVNTSGQYESVYRVPEFEAGWCNLTRPELRRLYLFAIEGYGDV